MPDSEKSRGSTYLLWPSKFPAPFRHSLFIFFADCRPPFVTSAPLNLLFWIYRVVKTESPSRYPFYRADEEQDEGFWTQIY